MIVYLITNKINGKRYVGQTIQPMVKRFRQHCCSSVDRSQKSAIKDAILKYGKESFEIKILAKCDSVEQMNSRESYYIRLLRTSSPNGYNMDSGGLNKIPSIESRKKMSESGIGRKLSEEHKNKIGNAQKGISRKKWSPETRERILTSRKKNPRKWDGHTQECKKHLSEKAIIRERDPEYKKMKSEVNNYRKVKIVCNETGTIYESVRAVSTAMGCHRSQVTAVINGRAKTIKGFTFSKVGEK